MWDTWIEGIGSIEFYGLFFPLLSDMTLCGDFYQFACFKHNDTTLYLDNPNCERCFYNLCKGCTFTNIYIKVYKNRISYQN